MEETVADILPAVVPALAIVTPQLLLTIVGGALVSLLGGLLKSKFSKFSPKLVITVVAIALGVLYYVFSTFVPLTMQQAIVDFGAGSLAFAVLIYEFIYKTLFPGKKK